MSEPLIPPLLSLFNMTNTIHKIDLQKLSNMTHNELAGLFPQMEENIPSLVNSAIFLISYVVVMIIVGVIIVKYWKELKKNQKIIYFIVLWCIGQQSIGLVLRVCFNSYALWMDHYVDYTKIENMQDKLITLAVLSLIESLAVYGQGVTVVIVVAFIMNMFMNTIRNAGGFTTKTHAILKYSLNIMIGIGAGIIGLCILLNIGIELAQKLVNLEVDIFPILVVLFLTFIIILVLESIVFIIMGVKLFRIVKNSHHVTQANKQLHLLQKPETKIIGLMIGMILSAYMQILAAIVSIITGELANYLHVIDYFLQAGGILLFSIFVLLVHNPLLSFNLEKSKPHVDIPLSQALSLSEKYKHSPRRQSQHYSTKHVATVVAAQECEIPKETNQEDHQLESSTTSNSQSQQV